MLRERRRHASFKPNRKLDRKSSRGMIYENEELRLRTININAEVERGQSDIKKLRRENYHLRKEIWTLRDEHDRLGKLLRSRNREGGGSSSYVGAGDSDADEKIAIDDYVDDYDYEYDDDYRCCSCHSNEDEISCDICNDGDNDAISGRTDSTNELTTSLHANNMQSNPSIAAASANVAEVLAATTSSILKSSSRPEKMDIQFDHLSVVSEECLSNSDDQVEQQKRIQQQMLAQSNLNNSLATPPTPSNGADNFVPEKSAARLYADFQSSVPPLAHFENLSYKDIGPNVDSLGELQYNSESTPTTGETVVPTLGWDFDLHQPLSMTIEEVLPATSTTSISSIEAVPSTITTVETDTAVPKVKNFFAPLKTKVMRQMQMSPENGNQNELRPDLCIGNVLACDTNKLATIRRPHNPLKCPISQQNSHEYANVSRLMPSPQSDAALDTILHDIEDLSKDIEHMQFHNNRIYEDSRANELQQPYRTEMSVVLSYDGNQKNAIEKQQSSAVTQVDNCNAGPDTPTQTLPRAMKLLPNTLPYINMDASIPSTSRSECKQDEMERENDENAAVQNANVEPTGKNVNFMPTTKSDESANDAATNSAKNAPTRKSFFGRKPSVGRIKRKDSIMDATITEPDTENASDEKEVPRGIDANNLDSISTSSKKSIDAQKRTKSGRRVSIHFNGKQNAASEPLPINESTQQLEVPPASSNETEEVKLTPILHSRRHHSISSRKDSVGSILYPSSPFLMRRASKKPMLSRRHSDGLLPFGQRAQYYPHLEFGGNHATKHMGSRHHHHHHHGHAHHHHPSVPYKEPENLQDMLGTCNSLASSRESSTSLSQRSSSQQKRKLSITSHSQSSGKIPWCACWGNGCI